MSYKAELFVTLSVIGRRGKSSQRVTILRVQDAVLFQKVLAAANGRVEDACKALDEFLRRFVEARR